MAVTLVIALFLPVTVCFRTSCLPEGVVRLEGECPLAWLMTGTGLCLFFFSVSLSAQQLKLRRKRAGD